MTPIREPIAIVGIGCRFPGAAHPRAFRSLLREGRSAVTAPDPARGLPLARGGFLDAIDGFDWRAFRVPPKEARALDPQHRLLLEVAWEAFEDAGLTSEALAGSRTGVHVGISWNDYLRMLCAQPDRLEGYATTGNLFALAANRISFFFDLQGPSEAVDGACASSLLSVLAACRCLRAGEIDLALAGGVNLAVAADGAHIVERAGVLSAKGECRVLDAAADGVVRGEGAGLVVLRRLADVAPGDRVYATIRGGATGHNGRGGWIMAPRRETQADVIRRALADAGVAPRQVGYVELHGAATVRGDAIEAAALADALGPRRAHPCRIGSVKTNIGALEAAGGIAGLIKVALMLRHRELYPTLNLRVPNPEVDLDGLGLLPVREPASWDVPDGARMAGVTVTGLGGVNAHVVLSEPSSHPARSRPAPTPRALLVSAPDRGALRARALQLAELLDEVADPLALLDLSYTLCERRTHHRFRIAAAGTDAAQLAAELRTVAAGGASATAFAGEGTEVPGAARAATPEALAECCELHVRGGAVSWTGLFAGADPRVADLPGYPWQRERMWLEAADDGDAVEGGAAAAFGAADPVPEAPQSDLSRIPAAGRRAAVAGLLRERLAASLGLPDPAAIEDRQLFFDLGVTSISALALRSEVTEALGVELPSTVVYDHPTLERLTDFILGVLDGHAPRAGTTERRPGSTAVRRFGGASTEPIAVVGTGLRLPGGVASLDGFWELLRQGRHVSVDVPRERWDRHAYFDEDPAAPGRTLTRVGGFLDDVAGFDPEFFGISPREALTMDPQQRLLLETAYEALENAGQPIHALEGRRAGVFVGIMSEEYAVRMLQGRGYPAVDPHFYSGNGASFAAGRLSFMLGVRGPALAVNTACSSSLVAVHLALQSLRSGEADLALAGGVSLMISPLLSIVLTKAGLLSADGRCKTFDDAADGIGRGEGAGLVVLKRLADARADGDRVLALIRGSAMNHDGRSGGLTAPSGPAQQALIRAALQHADVAPDQVGWVEAHGTGTALGDPIEVNALAEVFGARDGKLPPLLIGSVKTNLGHLDSAAGIAGLLKVIAALQHREIPPHLHLETLTRKVPWQRLPFAVPTAPVPWAPIAGRRIAGVSSFGLSGVNAHVVVEEAAVAVEAEVATRAPDRAPRVVLVSARTDEALHQRAANLRGVVTRNDHAGAAGLDDVAFTTSVRGDHHERRIAVVAETADDLVAGLDAYLAGESDPALVTDRDSARGRVAFVFPGHGQQWSGMGRTLLEENPVFAEAVAECDAAFRAHVDWSLLDVLTAADDAGRLYLHRTDVLQPTLFALGTALARLWRAWGVEPDAVVGHSLGEITAAHVAGALTLDDAARAICQRALLTREAGGGMALLVCDVEQARAHIAAHPELCVAGVNGPQSVSVSGDNGAIDALLADLARARVSAFRIGIEYASHSPYMEPLLERFAAALAPLAPHDSALPVYSTLTGARIDGPALGASHWVRNLREPVRFAAAIEALLRDGVTQFVECGAHPVLGREIDAVMRQHGARGFAVASMRRGSSARGPLLQAAARLHTGGGTLRWEQIQRSGRFRPLPTYPWQRQRYWVDEIPRSAPVERAAHPLLGAATMLATRPDVRVHTAVVSASDVPWLTDHRVRGEVVMPGAAWLELATAALRTGDANAELHDVEFVEPLAFADGSSCAIQVIVEPADGGARRVGIWSAPDPHATVWRCHFRARGVPSAAASTLAFTAAVTPDALQPMSGAAHRAALQAEGLEYGPAFHTVHEVRRDDGFAVASVQLPGGCAVDDRYVVPPALLDGCLQVLRSAAPSNAADRAGTALLPAAVRRFAVHAPVPDELTCDVVLRAADAAGVTGDVLARDAAGVPRIELHGVHLRRAEAAAADPAAGWFLRMTWRPTALPPMGATGAPRHWLILPDGGGVATALEARLRAVGHGVERIELEHGADHAAWRDAIAARLRAAQSAVGVIHLRGLDHTAASLAALRAAETDATMTLLGAAQALAATPGAGIPPRLCVVTRGAQVVDAETTEEMALPQTPLWGLLRTVASEVPALASVAIDLPTRRADDELEGLLADLLADDGEAQVARRRGARYVARLERVPAPAPATPLAGRGTWLVTGGLGGLGLRVAAWLAGLGARSLVLAGRSAPGAEAQRVLDELRSSGVDVRCVQADVARPDEAEALAAAVRSESVPLCGVVHSAGVLADAVLGSLDAAAFRCVAEPKLDGAWNLHRATLEDPPDHFILFSSMSGVLGTPGQANYAAANAFLDALAQHRRSRGLPAQSIAWGAWQEAGVAAERNHLDHLDARGLGAMPPQDALDALGRVMAHELTNVVIAPFAAERWHAVHASRAQTRLLEMLLPRGDTARVGTGAPTALAEELTAAGPAAGLATVERHLRRAVADVLGYAPDRIDATRPFADLGLDSLLTTELRNALESRHGLVLPIAVFWEHATLHALTRHVHQLLSGGAASNGVPDATAHEAAARTDDVAHDGRTDDEELEVLKQIAELLDAAPADGARTRRFDG